ncbi:MAG: immunity 26/phosphotriesterase HocA family protein [Peptococcaceae bacterium]|nr:immunity 26/phosphotriesterase HocA family protein [Peptococcaceae bacterium]
MAKEHMKYYEGQWFAIPLQEGGYALGIIVRGNYQTKGGLGYFFGPRYDHLPEEKETLRKKPEDAILITQFGDLGIINGSWPIIQSSRPFIKEEWPIPKFGSANPLLPQKAFIREYQQDGSGNLQIVRELVVDAKVIEGIPSDGSMGGGAVEIHLSKLISG